LDRDAERFRHLHAGPRNQLIERTSGDELHGNELRAVGMRNLVDRNDVRMVERGGCTRFLHEPAAPFLIARFARRKYLESDKSVELRIAGLIDNTHAAFAKLFEHLEVRQRAAGHYRTTLYIVWLLSKIGTSPASCYHEASCQTPFPQW